MTPKLLRDLKEANLSCTSPSSATTINQQSMLMSSSGAIGGRAIDRCSPHLRDPLRAKSLNSQPPTNKPKPFNSKGKKNAAEQLISPASSQRYLLSESYSEEVFEPDAGSFVAINEPSRFQAPKIEEETVVRPMETAKIESVKVEEANDANASSSSSSSSSAARPREQQVVVLRVSLHCKGCEGKVRKHISKMEGVTSFTTDLVNKKVTVIGDVTPLGVLNSISKVKNAQLWPSQTRAPPSS